MAHWNTQHHAPPHRGRPLWLSAGVFLLTAVLAPRGTFAQTRAALRTTSFGRWTIASPRLSPSTDTPFVIHTPPPSETSRVTRQFVAASVGAVLGGLGAYVALRDVSETRVKGDEGYTRSGNVGYLFGSFAGATFGAHIVGTRLGGRAPIWATSLGGLIGTVPLIALGVDEPYLPLFGIALGWIPQAALATGGFNMAEPR